MGGAKVAILVSSRRFFSLSPHFLVRFRSVFSAEAAGRICDVMVGLVWIVCPNFFLKKRKEKNERKMRAGMSAHFARGRRFGSDFRS